MAHSQAGQGQDRAAKSLEYTLDCAYPELLSVPTGEYVQGCLNSKSLFFQQIRPDGRQRVLFTGVEKFTVGFTNISSKSRRVNCDCANAKPCSHIFYAYDKLANLHCSTQNLPRSSECVIYIDPNDRDRQVSLEVNQVDIWPHELLKHVTLTNANEFVRQHTGMSEGLAGLGALLFPREREMGRGEGLAELVVPLFPHQEELFPEREIYSAVAAELNPIVARACSEDEHFASQLSSLLTPKRRAALRLESIRCRAERAFAALNEQYLGLTSHDERLVKRTLEECASLLYTVYRELVSQVSGREDISQASSMSAATLIFMINGALQRCSRRIPTAPSLWEEMTDEDYNPGDPGLFWTNVFFAFDVIIHREGILTLAHNTKLKTIFHLIQERTHPPPQRILRALEDIIRRSPSRELVPGRMEDMFADASVGRATINPEPSTSDR